MLLSLQLSWLSSLSTLRHTDRHLRTTQNRVPSKLTHSQSHQLTRPLIHRDKPFSNPRLGLGPRGQRGPGVDRGAGVGVPSLFLPPPPLFLAPVPVPSSSHHVALTLPGTQMSPEVQQFFSRCLLRVFPIHRPSRVPPRSTWHQRRTSQP